MGGNTAGAAPGSSRAEGSLGALREAVSSVKPRAVTEWARSGLPAAPAGRCGPSRLTHPCLLPPHFHPKLPAGEPGPLQAPVRMGRHDTFPVCDFPYTETPWLIQERAFPKILQNPEHEEFPSPVARPCNSLLGAWLNPRLGNQDPLLSVQPKQIR